jgi:hypothetical protein
VGHSQEGTPPAGCGEPQNFGPGAAVVGNVLYANATAQIVALDTAGPEVMWRFKTLHAAVFYRQSPVAFGDDLFFSWRDPGTIFRLKPAAMIAGLPDPCRKSPGLTPDTNSPLAMFRVSGTISFSTPALTPDGQTLLSGEHKGGSCLFALDLSDTCPSGTSEASGTCKDGAFWDSNEGVYRLKRKWDFHQTNGNSGFFSSGASASDGETYFIGSNEGVFWALKNKSTQGTGDPPVSCHTALVEDQSCANKPAGCCTKLDDWNRVRWCWRTQGNPAGDRADCGTMPTGAEQNVPNSCVPVNNVPLPQYECEFP